MDAIAGRKDCKRALTRTRRMGVPMARH